MWLAGTMLIINCDWPASQERLSNAEQSSGFDSATQHAGLQCNGSLEQDGNHNQIATSEALLGFLNAGLSLVHAEERLSVNE